MSTANDANCAGAAVSAPKKKQRIGTSSGLPSTLAVIDLSDESLTKRPRKPPLLRRTASHSLSHFSPSSASADFNDQSTADVVLGLLFDRQSSSFDCVDDFSESSSIASPEIQIYLHSRVLHRSKYFAALLSDRWQQKSDATSSMDEENGPKILSITHLIPASNDSMNDYLTVLKLLYSDDLLFSIDNLSTALDLLPIALELLFEDCVRACVRFIEAVPWSEDDEKRILSLIPLLSEEESKELLARLSPLKNDSSEEMLHGLILSAIHSHSNMAFAKAFVAKLLRDFSSRETARKVLDAAFDKSLRVVKQSLEEYSSPDFRGSHDETEAIQRLNLHTAVTNLKHVLWLVERMIELRVADSAVKAWSEQASLTADLRRAFLDDLWRAFFPGLPSVVLRCTCRLANAVVTGNILAARQVRMKLVRDWLPVLIICKERVSIMGSNSMSLYVELEEIFLRIISTLPISDAQELLQQCLSFSTRNIDDCPHLIDAFTTWFRRANRPPQADLCE
ncbi:BTB/POZ domain-containing protein At1g63850-like [Salvia miltiorrhiza]|uniref:BTB/POZ domain-containing protein At1g63850-like n=1 Tax=Salvia miltiorrhiza TaxID=226208 RepID=UPI0025AC651C|nr:BTB/POZ domain-containing protein At1g63850-like [Salvia miltiorrhiza]